MEQFGIIWLLVGCLLVLAVEVVPLSQKLLWGIGIVAMLWWLLGAIVLACSSWEKNHEN